MSVANTNFSITYVTESGYHQRMLANWFVQAPRDTDEEIEEYPKQKFLKGWHCSWENFERSIDEIEHKMEISLERNHA